MDQYVYLQKPDGNYMRVFVENYVLDQNTKREYLVALNQSLAKKCFEVYEKQVSILTDKDAELLDHYQENDRFIISTDRHPNKERYQIVKEFDRPIIYYVFDNGNLRSYKANLEMKDGIKILVNIRFLRSYDNIPKMDVEKIITEQQHFEPTYLVLDKMNDLEYQMDGTIILHNWRAVSLKENSVQEAKEPSILNEDPKSFLEKKEEEETIIFYVQDHDIIQKYQGNKIGAKGESIIAKDLKLVVTIKVTENFDFDQFIVSDTVEMNAYFVSFRDYDPEVKLENGVPVAQATIRPFLQKTEHVLESYKQANQAPVLEESSQDEKNLEEKIIVEPIIFYVDDQDVIQKYQGNMITNKGESIVARDLKLMDTIRVSKNFDFDQFIASDTVEMNAYFVSFRDYDSEVKLENGNPVAFATIRPFIQKTESVLETITQKEDTVVLEESIPEETLEEETFIAQPIIFYVHDNDVVKEYQGMMVENMGTTMSVQGIKLMDVIHGTNNLNVESFLENIAKEGAYFTTFDSYEPDAIEKDGKIISTATIHNFLQKKPNEKKEEPKKELETAIAFSGDIQDGKSGYSIYGIRCEVLSKDPLTLRPLKTREKTIVFHKTEASSLEEVCQEYQNLYPTPPIYLLKGVDMISETQILDSKNYQTFAPQQETKTESLLEQGRRVLTEAEMEAQRKKELAELQKKKLTNQYRGAIAEEYLRSNPEDISFAHYISALEAAGMTKEHMQATGLLDTIQKKSKPEPLADFKPASEPVVLSDSLPPKSKPEVLVDFEPVPTKPMTLSDSFQKRFVVVKAVNDDILKNIQKMERLGHSANEIVEELNLPRAMVDLMRQDIPELEIKQQEKEKLR